MARSLGSRRFNLLLLGGFATIALVLASIGIYGLLSQIVAGRRAEIGVHLVLGARPVGIVRLIGGGALASVSFGVLVGLILALLALYRHRLAGRWSPVYALCVIVSLYLNVFVLIVQGFQKVSFLQPYAPTGSEPAFAIAQGVALAAFVILGAMAVKRFHPMRLIM